MVDFFKKYQQSIAIVTGYLLVFLLAFALGRITILLPSHPEIRIEEPVESTQANDNPEVRGAQTQGLKSGGTDSKNSTYPKGFAPQGASCEGKIKGSSSKIYHLPGGAFYERTTKPVICFYTESDALASGFRKSAR